MKLDGVLKGSRDRSVRWENKWSRVVPRLCLVLQAEKDLIPGERVAGPVGLFQALTWLSCSCSSLYPLSKRKSMFLRHDVLTQKSCDEIETKIETNKGALRENEAGKSCTLSSTAAPTPLFCQPVNFRIMTPQSDVSAGP